MVSVKLAALLAVAFVSCEADEKTCAAGASCPIEMDLEVGANLTLLQTSINMHSVVDAEKKLKVDAEKKAMQRKKLQISINMHSLVDAEKKLTEGAKGQCETYENTENLCTGGSTCCGSHGCGGFGEGEEWNSYMQCYPCDWKEYGTTFTSDSCPTGSTATTTTTGPIGSTTATTTATAALATVATVPVVWQVIKTTTGKGDMSAEEINQLMDNVNKRFTGVDVDTWTPPKPGSVPPPDVTGILASGECQDKCNVAFCFRSGTATDAATKKKVEDECFCEGSDGAGSFCKLYGWKYKNETAMDKPIGNQLMGQRVDTGIRFKVESINYVTNDDWHFHCCCTHAGFDYKIAQQEIFDQLIDKTTVRSKATVIVCDMSTKGGGTAGQSSISGSDSCAGGPGVMVDRNSMKPDAAGLGAHADTLVHEFGHFLGLYHTFNEHCPSETYGTCKPQDICNAAKNTGDKVDDTPVMIKQGQCKIDASGETFDSCPNQPGRDPLDNFMSYSSCSHQRFTQGQVARMHSTIENYFPALLTNSGGRVAKDLPCDPEFPSKIIPAGYSPSGGGDGPTTAPSPSGGGNWWWWRQSGEQPPTAPSPSGGGDGIKTCSSLEADQCATDATGCVCAAATNCCKNFGCASWTDTEGLGTCLPCSWADGGATLLFTTDSCKTV